MRHLCPGQEIIIGNARPARVTTTGQWRRQWQRHKHKPQEQQQQQWQRRSCKDNSTTCLTPWPTAYLFIFPGWHPSDNFCSIPRPPSFVLRPSRGDNYVYVLSQSSDISEPPPENVAEILATYLIKSQGNRLTNDRGISWKMTHWEGSAIRRKPRMSSEQI